MIKGENEFMTDVLFYQNYTYVDLRRLFRTGNDGLK